MSLYTEWTMRSLTIPAALAAIALSCSPSHAYYMGPWCGVYTIGPGSVSEKCDYRTFEACRRDIVAGNRGFCRQNGYFFQGYAPEGPYPRKKHRHAHY